MPILSFAVFITAAALGDLSPQYAAWGSGPVQHLMTAAEKEEWAAIRDDGRAERFVALFWVRRDPTPSTPENEHRALFDVRVDHANQKFRTPELAGAMTPMGRVFILLGSPHRVSRNRTGPTSTVQSGLAGDLSMSVSTARGQELPTEIWFYEEEHVPSFSTTKAFEIAFIDQYGTQDWELSRTPRTNVTHLLELGVSSFLAPGSFRSAPLQKAVDEFRASEAESRGSVFATWGEYATKRGETFVSLQLFVPSAARAAVDGADAVFARIEDEGGRIVRAHEQPTTLNDAHGDLWTDLSFLLPPGRYAGVFGLTRKGQPLVMMRALLDVRGVDVAAPGTSPLILTNKIYPLAEAQRPTDPFAFGGLKVVPKGDRTFRRSEELLYFVELRNPGVDGAGQPSLQVELDIEGGNGKLRSPLAKAETQPVKGIPGRFMTASSIPLSRFTAGEYTIRVQLTDSVRRKTWKLEERFRVAE